MNNNLFLKCLIFVAAVHLGLIGWGVFVGGDSEKPIKPHMQKLVARTVSCCEEKPIEKQKTNVAIAETKQPPVPASLPPPKKEPPKTTEVKPKPLQSNPKKEPNVKKIDNKTPKATSTSNKVPEKPKDETKSSAVSKKTAQLKDSLAKLQSHLNETQSQKQSKSELAELKGIPDLNIDNIDLSGIESGYYSALISCLKENLVLPDIGDVKVRLSVTRNGTVNKVEIMQSKSKLNKEYLEKQLPSLKLPSFGSYFKDAQIKEFVITLTNNN